MIFFQVPDCSRRTNTTSSRVWSYLVNSSGNSEDLTDNKCAMHSVQLTLKTHYDKRTPKLYFLLRFTFASPVQSYTTDMITRQKPHIPYAYPCSFKGKIEFSVLFLYSLVELDILFQPLKSQLLCWVL